ncbi:DUF1801 domain-containing protein [Winogradskyella jejuensis]|uniref:YdhG-like domain-containing protein n=1 Tax=Winogradskyella jejuensis TaxID=1089305 RepID=A0A1M5KAT7_9FLAO|nr:DUF1801 domain-containing protein [Winogradskyella jejuensis]SHG49740.1 protein of unknown function (DU1801) [Winogradskyella jejuensis]
MKPAEDYILKQEEPFKSILLQLQSVIEAILPEPELLYKWRIPFYYNNDLPVCYLNQSKNYVDLAFWHGDKLTEYREHFVTENRKSVTSLRYKLVEDINDEVIQYVLEEQLRININPFKLTRVGKAKN